MTHIAEPILRVQFRQNRARIFFTLYPAAPPSVQ